MMNGLKQENKSRKDEGGEYKYIPSYIMDYNEENKEKIKTNKTKASEIMLEKIKEDGLKVKIEGILMIKRNYTFYRLNGLGKEKYTKYEPTDLESCVKKPFDEWNKPLYIPVSDFCFFAQNTKIKTYNLVGKILV